MAIEFMGKNFVYTGLVPEDEDKIKRIILTRGGVIKTAVSGKTDYVIAAQWDTSKCKTAEKLRDKGASIEIIPYMIFLQMMQPHRGSMNLFSMETRCKNIWARSVPSPSPTM